VKRKLRHDLRSPLAVVIGRADLLLSEVHGTLNADQRRSVEAILESAGRLQRDLEALADEIDPRPDDGDAEAG
jgi:K+-sensing histidine kinase KdpD